MSNTFYQMRIKLDDNPIYERDISNVKLLCHRLIKKYSLELYSFGDEVMNKKGKTVPRHIHFNFEMENAKGENDPHRNMKLWIRKQIPSLKGPAIWSLPPPKEVGNLNKWLRYPLKLNGDPRLFACPDYVNFDYATEEVLAKNEYADVVARNVAYEEKQENKNSLYEKMSSEILLDISQNPQPISVSSIFLKMVKYYCSNSKPVNHTTINGYVITFLIQNHYISPETYTALNCQNTNLPIIHNALLPQTPSTTQTPSPQLQTTPETKEG